MNRIECLLKVVHNVLLMRVMERKCLNERKSIQVISRDAFLTSILYYNVACSYDNDITFVSVILV